MALNKLKPDPEKGARRALLEELFNDFYHYRHKVYKINFVRGLFFGVGSVLGGTVVIALLVWVLSLFIDFPVVGEYFQDVKQTLERPE